MRRAWKTLAAACLGVCLLSAATAARAQPAPLQGQIAQHEQKLAAARASGDRRTEGLELVALGYLYRQAGKMQTALERLNAALTLSEKAHNDIGRALAMNTMGRIYSDLGQEEKALALFRQVLPLWRSAGIREGEGDTLNFMGKAYNDLGRREEALKSLNDSMAIWHALDSGQAGDRLSLKQRIAQRRLNASLPMLRDATGHAAEASTLDNLGKTYTDMGQGAKALEYLNQAMTLWRAEGERGGEALTLNNMGRAYADLGQKQTALEAYDRALAIERSLGNRPGEALTLTNKGRLLRDLSQHQAALEFFEQALPIWREVGSRNGEGLALNDIGRAYADMGQGARALEYLNQALPIWAETGSRRGDATTMANISRVHLDLGDAGKSLDFALRALAAYREVEDRRGQALALGLVGRGYWAAKDADKALVSELAALDLAREAGDPAVEGGIESLLMVGFRNQHHPEEAILFGLQAVTAYQQIRRNISSLDKELQAGFVQSKSAAYRILAELLVQSDRLAEAEQVLDLLKEQELKEVVRGAADRAGATAEAPKLTGTQQAAQGALAARGKQALALMNLSAEHAALRAKPTRTSEETARMNSVEAEIEATNREVSDFFRNTLYPQLAQKAGTEGANARVSGERSDVSRLQNTLANLGPHVLGIRLLLGDEHAYAIVVTSQARKKFELKATPAELRSKVLQVRDELRTPASDPRPHLAELFAMVVAPFGEELAALEGSEQDPGRAPTLLWSLDGVMRYLPMAALYDGRRFLAERFNNVLFTPESYGHMTAAADATGATLKVLAMGLSKSYGGLPALPGVLSELDGVVHDPAVPESHGPIDGMLLPDDRFTYAALQKQLGAGSTFPVVHIASHFVIESEGDKEPYLMLGGDAVGSPGGFQLTLSKLEDSTISFHGTRLLTLSACSTARGEVAKDGLEMDSLGMVAQQKDAEAVLATLWDVNDASTSRMMSDFYARWMSHPADGKAEALRQAQLAFLRGSAAPPGGAGGRGIQPVEGPASPPREAGYTHPFYWAPFVLIGSYQ